MSSSPPQERIDSSGTPAPDRRRVGRKLPGVSGRDIALRVAACVVALGVIGYVVLLPVRFPYVVTTYATITPAQKWVLARASNGQLVENLFNFRSGMNEGFRASTFNPGSSVNFSLHSTLQAGQAIAAGDTVGSVFSSEVQERLVALQGQLSAARSLLLVTSTGQKAAIVNESEQRLQFARRRSAEHQSIEARTQKLFAAQLIAEGEFDRVRSEANALRDEITIAAANLEAARTGAKPEQLNLVHANIAALQSEVESVRRRAASHTVTAPISGTLTATYSSDTLLTISAPEYIALLPVKWSDYRRVAASPRARLRIDGLASAPVYGTLLAMNRELHILNGNEVVIATALLDPTSTTVMAGMLVRCRIECAPVTAVEYGRHLFVALTATQPILGGF